MQEVRAGGIVTGHAVGHETLKSFGWWGIVAELEERAGKGERPPCLPLRHSANPKTQVQTTTNLGHPPCWFDL